MIRTVSTLITLLLLVAAPAAAFTINGRIVNGTTGATDIDASVIVVNPSGGMAQEQTIQAVAGAFTVLNLDRSNPIYLIRVDYKGVMYTTPVQFSGVDPIDIVVTFYETTTSWDAVHIRVPHLAASRHTDHLTIERLYEIHNDTDPPMTLGGESGMFEFDFPADMVQINGSYVSALGMPIEREPEATDIPGRYRINYPLRPGVTRIGISFTVPYKDDSYTLNETLLYDIQELTVFQADPDMDIAITGATFSKNEAAHGMTAFTALSLKKSSLLSIAFSGGSGRSAVSGADNSNATPIPSGATVQLVPNEMEEVSLIVMLVMLIALGAFFSISITAPTRILEDPTRLRSHYDLLLKRMARLDDLFALDTVSAEVHRIKRTELKNQLATLVLKLRAIESPSLSSTPPEDSQDDTPTRQTTQTQ